MAFLAIWLLGPLTTAAFNLTTGRFAPFDRESPIAWLVPPRSLVTPTLYIAGVLLVVGGAIVRRVLNLSTRIEELLKGCEARSTV